MQPDPEPRGMDLAAERQELREAPGPERRVEPVGALALPPEPAQDEERPNPPIFAYSSSFGRSPER